jgi:hypothetical protein
MHAIRRMHAIRLQPYRGIRVIEHTTFDGKTKNGYTLSFRLTPTGAGCRVELPRQ